jgi:hypothetical protein
MRSLKIIVSAFAVVCVWLAAVDAGTIIQFEQRALDPTADSGKGTFYLDEKYARLEFESETSYEVMIYNGEDKKNPLIWLIDQNGFTYIELRKDDMGKLQGKIKDQLEFMENQMQQMPAAQREQLQKQFHSQIKAMNEIVEPRDTGKLSYESAESAKVSEWECKAYKCFYDGELEDEVWVASWKDAGMSEDDVSVIRDMVEAFGPLTGMVFMRDLWQAGAEAGIAGFPVKTVSYVDGAERDEVKIVKIAKSDIKADMWELPNGLDERSFLDQ